MFMILVLFQVKEVGIYLVDCPKIAKSVETYFGNLWKLASLNSSAYTRTVSDQQWQVNRTVPCWSHFIDSKERCRCVGGFSINLIKLFVSWNQFLLVR
jgi:phospholipase D3/4